MLKYSHTHIFIGYCFVSAFKQEAGREGSLAAKNKGREGETKTGGQGAEGERQTGEKAEAR